MAATKMRQPFISLGKAVEIANIIYKEREISKNALANTIGHKDANKSDVKRKFATLQYFGLAESEDDKLKSEKICKTIFAPTKQREEKEAIFRAFCNYKIYNELYKEYPKDAELQKTLVANAVEQKHGLAPTKKDKFMQILIESGKYAGIIEEIDNSKFKFLEYEIRDEEEPEEEEPEEEEPEEEEPEEEEEMGAEEGINIEHRPIANFNIDLKIDSNMTKDKLKDILDQLKDSLPALF